MRTRQTLIGWLLLAGVIGSAPAAAQRGNNRMALERQVQQTLWRLTRQRVGLSDAQMKQLAPVNQRFETRRREILRQERETRVALRNAVMDSGSVDQTQVGQHIDRLLQLQRQRLDLVEQEQRELAKFMTPQQRAKYMALQEQVRRRVEQMRRRERAAEGVGEGQERLAPSKRP